MKLIINASTLSASGATQVSTSFIYECLKFPKNDYHILTSPTVEQQINKSDFPAHFHFYSIPNHPLYGWKGFKSRKLIRKLAEDIHPDVVFSVFGPSWWKPSCPHLMGYAYPHYVYPESPLFGKLSFKEKLDVWLKKKIHIYFLNRDASYFVSETDDVSKRLKKLMPSAKNNFYTVGNTFNSFFRDFVEEKNHKEKNLLPAKSEYEFRFLSLCTFHKHKNLEILNEVIPILNKNDSGKNIKFVLTLDDENFENRFSAEAKRSLINVGRQPVQKCAQLYEESDSLFLPTLLECFSANYPEAMFMKKPIVTSDLTFATSVCGDAAIYFDPTNAKDISEKLLQIYHDQKLREDLILKGTEQLDNFPDAKERARQYLSICESIAKK